MKAFMITRDRVTYARQTAEALDNAGLDTVIVDHGSTWEPMVAWLAERESGGTPVFRRGPGWHPRDLWTFGDFYRLAGRERYIATDPDTPPSRDCPSDWLDHMASVLDRFPEYPKVGMAMRIDNLPDHYQRKHQVLTWEGQYWSCFAGNDSDVFAANVDTTLALYQPLRHTSEHTLAALRTNFPYVAEHLPWYEDFGNLTDELKYYYEHGERVSFWAPAGKSEHWQD